MSNKPTTIKQSIVKKAISKIFNVTEYFANPRNQVIWGGRGTTWTWQGSGGFGGNPFHYAGEISAGWLTALGTGTSAIIAYAMALNDLSAVGTGTVDHTRFIYPSRYSGGGGAAQQNWWWRVMKWESKTISGHQVLLATPKLVDEIDAFTSGRAVGVDIIRVRNVT